MMKSMFIFILLFCIRICEIDCGEEGNVSTSRSSNEISSAQHIDTPNSSPKEPSTEPADPPAQPEALQLIKRRKKGGFDWPLTPNSVKLQRGDTVVNVCPAESTEERGITRISDFQYCLFVKEESKKALGTRKCQNEPEPKLWNMQLGLDRCGEKGKGALYTYIYQVCWKSKSIMTKLPNFDSKFINRHFPKVKQEFVEVYTACLHYQKDILYLKYTLVPATGHQEQQDLKHHELQTKTDGLVKLEFDKNAELYNIEKQMKSLKEFFGNNFDEYLVPEMLISPLHITPLLAKNSLHNYLNVAPQWSSMKNKWQQLESYIWSLGIKSTETIFIYAGIQGKITKHEEQLNVKIDSSSFNVPSVWWKLILNNDYEEGIVIAMQNKPEKSSSLGTKLCYDSVCNSHGWEEISEIAYCCIFDDKMQKLLNLHEEKLTINGVFNPKTEISSRPPKPKPKKPESETNKWLKKVLRRKPKSTNDGDDDE